MTNGNTSRRFAILVHDHPFVHWDLLIEEEQSARTWRLHESPDRWLLATEPVVISAEEIAQHRLRYLDYEGPVSRERGTVMLWDRGEILSWIQNGVTVEAELVGRRLNGRLRITETRTAGSCDVTFAS